MGLTVAVTGPTGDIGISAVTALDQDPAVERVIGMARRPFDLAAQDWRKTEYRQGDILDRDAVDALVADADIVVHLAFIIMARAWVAASQGAVSEAITIAMATAERSRAAGKFAEEVMSLQTAAQFGDRTAAPRLRELESVVEGPRAGLAARLSTALHDGDAAELAAVSEEFEAMGPCWCRERRWWNWHCTRVIVRAVPGWTNWYFSPR